MEHQEIQFFRVGDDEFDSIVSSSLKYALLSAPFTVDRMNLNNPRRQIFNITKGKIAEKYFEHFCINNGLKADFDSCVTPFWQTDKRDFIFQNKEWDIKNNFIYHPGRKYKSYVKLPALVPNRHHHDQWNNRKKLKHQHSMAVHFLFTFMKGADLKNGTRGSYFFDIHVSQKQLDFIAKLVNHYKGLPQDEKPFHEATFWKRFLSKGPGKLSSVNFVPNLVITGYSSEKEWHLFENTGPKTGIRQSEKRYKKVGRNKVLKWHQGAMWTKIKNSTAPVGELPSFTSLLD